MARIFFEGFEAYDTGTHVSQQASIDIGAGGGVNVVTSPVRTGAGAFEMGTNSSYWRRLFTMSGNVLIVGVGVYLTASAGMPIEVRSSSTGRRGVCLSIEGVNQLTVRRNGTLLWQNTEGEALNTWLHFEMKVDYQSGATGSWSLKRNGALVISQASVQTKADAADVINQAGSWNDTGSGGPRFYIDDYYICDGSGSDMNDFLGPVRAGALRPTSDASVAMTPSSGSNWQCVDDTTPNDDTDYVSAPPTGLPLTDRYGMSNLPPEASLIRSVRTIYRARKEDAALVELVGLVESGGTIATGTTRALDTSYTYYTDFFDVDPDTAAAWTPAAVDAMTAGVRRVT